MNLEQRQKNIRVAWVLAAFALFIFITSFPFWQGVYKLVMGGNQ